MKGMKHRSRSEIIGAILEAANGGGATKTTIMFKAVLAYEHMKVYLLSLIEDGLIEYEQGMMTLLLLLKVCIYLDYTIMLMKWSNLQL